ncbi:MAG TPA: phosphatidylserine/phosphatidylglycerophosphate/cardiolipin synthase family protein [Bacteroidales bacterium]|nr:phosphatidylserine/phosphatidylglycerophosphate/cardiolipin synthase family protein [Bacteroidales bacterium]
MKKESRTDYRKGHYVELLSSGEPYFAACEKVIDSAKRFIHFQTYIVDDDETGRRIVKSLIRAAGRGVKVYFLLDAFGGRSFLKHLVNEVEEAGILFRKFSPVFIMKGFQLSLRLHHKVLLADGNVAIIGGMNMANRYHGTSYMKEWLDFAVLIKGPECAHVLTILKKLWNKTFFYKKGLSREVIHNSLHYPENIRVKILQNNWYRNKIEILKGYRHALTHARHRMIIMASYFLPGRSERRLFRDASLRGVDIKIILPSESDAPVFKMATSFLYDLILRNNIKLYEYLPSNLHAKVATVDGKWSTIGSYNLNHLSDYGSIEMNAAILDTSFTEEFEKLLLKIIEKDCRQVTFEEYSHKRTLLYKFSSWFSYQVIRILMRLMLLLTTKRKKSY